jgi:hypothetical protein
VSLSALRLPCPAPPLNSARFSRISQGSRRNWTGLDGALQVVLAAKSFRILAGPDARVGHQQEMNKIHCWEALLKLLESQTKATDRKVLATERYAYYRRCRLFRANGEQCKAPAMKGQSICNRHAEQLERERRWAEQRCEFYSRPGVGLASRQAIQKTLNQLAREILAGRIERRVIASVITDLQTIMRLHKAFRWLTRQRKGAPARVPVPHDSILAMAPVSPRGPSRSEVHATHSSAPGKAPVSHDPSHKAMGPAHARPKLCRNVMANALHGRHFPRVAMTTACNPPREAPRFPPWCSRKANARSRTGLRGCLRACRAG